MMLADTSGFITNTILKNLINFLAPVGGIALLVFVVVQSVKLIRGEGSLKKLLSGVGLILLCLGLMYAAGSFSTYGQIFSGAADKVIQQGGKDVGTMVG
jgi:type IV secretory pathway VirB2 component (pilin)